MSRKVCLLRSPAEVDALKKLQLLKNSVIEGKLSEEEARAEMDSCGLLGRLPECTGHRHAGKREAARLQEKGLLEWVPGWGQQYAAVYGWSGSGRRFRAGQMFSGDRVIGMVEMFGNG